MKRIWAPWRIDYVEGDKPEDGCPFCKALEDSDDEKRLVITRGRTSIVILNKYPYIGGHLLVASNRHIGEIEGLDDTEKLELLNMTARSMKALTKAMKPDGFNVGMNVGKAAGAGVPGHLHVHVVPRWVGDTNLVPVLGEARIINEHLSRTWQKIRGHWEQQDC